MREYDVFTSSPIGKRKGNNLKLRLTTQVKERMKFTFDSLHPAQEDCFSDFEVFYLYQIFFSRVTIPVKHTFILVILNPLLCVVVYFASRTQDILFIEYV
jgi:hypothetical protein